MCHLKPDLIIHGETQASAGDSPLTAENIFPCLEKAKQAAVSAVWGKTQPH